MKMFFKYRYINSQFFRQISASFAIKCILFFSFVSFSQNPIIIAHRGASAYAPENTLNSFEKAIEMGAMVIETDVHQTKDSVVVIMHGLSVDRTTFRKGLIKEMDLNTFKNCKVRIKNGCTFDYPPTLEEAIKIINGRCKLLMNLKKEISIIPRSKNILWI